MIDLDKLAAKQSAYQPSIRMDQLMQFLLGDKMK
ncbi:YcjX family protein [Colwellia sp. PAMC 20917]|nr:YcjX family protein [Colwellia sp. PAMC 20917]